MASPERLLFAFLITTVDDVVLPFNGQCWSQLIDNDCDFGSGFSPFVSLLSRIFGHCEVEAADLVLVAFCAEFEEEQVDRAAVGRVVSCDCRRNPHHPFARSQGKLLEAISPALLFIVEMGEATHVLFLIGPPSGDSCQLERARTLPEALEDESLDDDAQRRVVRQKGKEIVEIRVQLPTVQLKGCLRDLGVLLF